MKAGKTPDPKGPFAVIFEKPNGIEEFLREQAVIDDLIATGQPNKSCVCGTQLAHNVNQSKKAIVGRGIRQMLLKMTEANCAKVAKEYFGKTSAELFDLDDLALGKESKQAFQGISPYRATVFAHLFLCDCRNLLPAN